MPKRRTIAARLTLPDSCRRIVPHHREAAFVASTDRGGLIDLPLRAFNEGLLRPRVARAQKIIRLHPLSPSPLLDRWF